jgi:4,5-DOPA dioxygenase extradiol
MSHPALFISHGAPTLALANNYFTHAWAELGVVLGRPESILMVSAHWDTPFPAVSTAARLETIHDFQGFPEELYRVRYRPPGAPALAGRVAQLLSVIGQGPAVDPDRGIDHGGWVPLRWMYPDADVPVVQLAIQPEFGAAHHLRVGRALTSLADDFVLIIGSGHTTHNLRDWMSNPRRQEPLRYAQAFAEWLHDRLMAHDVDSLVAWREQAPEAARAHPSEEHFLPLFVALGAAADDAKVERFVDGFEAGALSMDSYSFGPH